MDIGKDLVAASATQIVLGILSREPSYGYAILGQVRDLSGGAMEWTDGMLYPVLHRLTRLGFVEAQWRTSESGRRRKYYTVTPAGHEHLAAQRQQWLRVNSTLNELFDTFVVPLPTGVHG